MSVKKNKKTEEEKKGELTAKRFTDKRLLFVNYYSTPDLKIDK